MPTTKTPNLNLDNYYERKPNLSEHKGRLYKNWKQDIDTVAEDVLIEILREIYPKQIFKKFEDPFSPLDFAILDRHTGETVAVCEIKRRNTNRRKYKTVPLNFRKIDGFNKWEQKQVPGYYFVMWADEIGYIYIHRAKLAKIGMIGTKRYVKAKSDIGDTCYLIPEDWFEFLCNTPNLDQRLKILASKLV